MSGIQQFRQAATSLGPATPLVIDKAQGGIIDRGTVPAQDALGGGRVIWHPSDRELRKADRETMASFKAALAEEHGAKPAAMLADAVESARKELAKLDRNYNAAGYPTTPGTPGAMSADLVKETRARLKELVDSVQLGKKDQLTAGTVQQADWLAGELAAHRHDPMVKMMGPTKFLGYLLAVEKQIASIPAADKEARAAAASMTTLEKVALYGYTCADYKVLNPALWNQGSKPLDPGVRAHIDHATSAIKKAPVYAEIHKSGLPVATERGVADPTGAPGWVQSRYTDGGTVTEAGFFSTTRNKAAGQYTMKVFGQGHDVSAFSAWPGEKEVLFPPGTEFRIKRDAGNPNEIIAVQNKGLDLSLWW